MERVSLIEKTGSLSGRVAAIHHEDGAGEKRSIIAGQVCEERGDFVRTGDAADGMITAKHVPVSFGVAGCLGGPIHDGSIDGAACDGVHADVVFRILDRHLTSHLMQGSF